MNTIAGVARFVLAVVAAALLSGCLEQLEAVNSALAKGSTAMSTLSGRASTPKLAAAPSLPVMTGSQRQAMRSQLSLKISDIAILQAREEAKDTIEKVLSTSACYPDWDVSKYLQPYIDPNHRFGVSAPMSGMTYHPKSQCLTVARLDGWRMLARNAFTFRAVYLSEASSESRSINYEMVKQADGAWLFR